MPHVALLAPWHIVLNNTDTLRSGSTRSTSPRRTPYSPVAVRSAVVVHVTPHPRPRPGGASGAKGATGPVPSPSTGSGTTSSCSRSSSSASISEPPSCSATPITGADAIPCTTAAIRRASVPEARFRCTTAAATAFYDPVAIHDTPAQAFPTGFSAAAIRGACSTPTPASFPRPETAASTASPAGTRPLPPDRVSTGSSTALPSCCEA